MAYHPWHLIKCSREQVREATSEEHLGLELVSSLMQSTLDDITLRGKRGFVDLVGEGAPPEEAELFAPAPTLSS